MYEHDNRVVMTLDAGGTNFVFSAIKGCELVIAPVCLLSVPDDLDRCLSVLVEGFCRIKDSLSEAPVAISFAFPGPADYEHGVIGDLPNFPAFCGGVALGPFLEEKFGIPVFINNDGNLFAYGEALSGVLPQVNRELEAAGNPKRYKNLLGITLGTGFGAGVVINNCLLTGDNGCGGDVWLMRNKKYPDMLAEESVSIRAIHRVYRELTGEDTDAFTPKDEQLTADGITVSEIVIKNRQSRQYAGLILFITAVAGVVAGAVLYGDMTVVISDEMLKNYLSGRIHGGFFGNAAASFIAALIWCIVPFISGLCAVGQPVGVLVPAFKGIGIGMTFSALLDTYGANGIPAFAAFILPSAFIGTFVCCYQCQLSLSCSNNILATLRGRRETAPHYYKIYIERFAVCCIGCFLLGIADAGISFLLGPIFVI